MFLLDTNIVSSLIADPSGAAARRLEARADQRTLINAIVLGELWFGAAKRNSARLTDRIARFVARTEIVPIEADAARAYGQVRADLARTGSPIGPNDTWIAAHALALGATVVTANEREFGRVAGLDVENWLTS